MGQARHLLALLALVGVALAVVLAGCGSSDETPESMSGRADSAPTSTAPRGRPLRPVRVRSPASARSAQAEPDAR